MSDTPYISRAEEADDLGAAPDALGQRLRAARVGGVCRHCGVPAGVQHRRDCELWPAIAAKWKAMGYETFEEGN